tara:strand:+ start:248 stop:706 length:459 start_codon:yes stop_codon:yes gene_type:complete
MGRGEGKHNMSVAELKEKKAERDADRYARNKKNIQRQNHILKMNAKTITCDCGGLYKDIKQNKYSHFGSQQHSLWEEEDDKQVKQLICKKIKDVNTLEEAQTKLTNLYLDADKYSYIQKECHLPKIIRALNRLPDKPPIIKIKKKLKIIIAE